ncbi:NADPH:quinone oxidoreductase family protein [Burkholderia cepacia]|uniref:Zinc-binding alcohol dehydrogenase n=1 Tax=Burkholderia cepacia GG4 TaxID=1009846 RepID=A0A9W3K514_BURCE|nr:NADPH:quinone oxidoreductase family protein [Burkholderia cepacia]AFQ51077.1 zinc-binding alcohol dehydrogenase [Burkholderia cepacia GG4]
MLALRVHGFDGLHQWKLEQAPEVAPGVGEVQVSVLANAISYVDLLFARGGYQVRPPLPLVPGTEFTGVVAALGPGVDGGLKVGQHVVGMTVGGAWAERINVPAGALEVLPPHVDMRAASALPVTYATALYALKHRGALRASETVLVLGAAGGVGLACVQVAKALGATVVAGVTGDEKMTIARQEGADHVIDVGEAEWRAAVQAAVPEGVDVVVDTIGDAYTETAFRTLRWGGRHLVIGFAGGNIPAIRANLPLLKGASLVGVDIRQFREREPDRARANLAEAVAMLAAGQLRPRVAQVYPAPDWAEAIRHAQDASTVGRVVLDWGAKTPKAPG